MVADAAFSPDTGSDRHFGVIVDEVAALAPQRQLLDPQLVAAVVRA